MSLAEKESVIFVVTGELEGVLIGAEN